MGAIDESDVIAVYDQWCTAFQAVDGGAMKRLFDQGSDGLIYQSEENADPMYTWAEIQTHNGQADNGVWVVMHDIVYDCTE